MSQTITEEPITFSAADGFMLQGLILRPERASLAVLVSAGTGFPKEFYRRLAMDFAARGAIVMLYDYRGIGASAPDDLANFQVDYPDWGRLDMPAALDALAAASQDMPIGHLAHSVGGHFIGFMPNHGKIHRHAFVAVGSGYWRKHPFRYNLTELYFWWVLGPYCLARWGYIQSIGGWRGAPLPAGIFKTWRRWSHSPGYYRRELADALLPHHFQEVDADIRAWIFTDDPIANASTAPDILACYPAARQDIVLRSPAEIGVSRIGHEGAFREGMQRLWDEWWRWLHATE